jgi:hypothetical protein
VPLNTIKYIPSINNPAIAVPWPRVLAMVPALLSAIFGGLIATKAVADLDTSWDSLAYHLPFAGLRAGVFDENEYRISDHIRLYYDGFPQFFYYVKGWVWRVTGRPELPQLLAIISITTLALYVRWLFKAPFSWTFLALLAIPVVHDSITSSFVDVPANAFMAIAIFGLCDGIINPGKFDGRRLGAIAAAMLCAAHIKPQMAVQLALVLSIFGGFVLYTLRRGDEGPGINRFIRARPALFIASLTIFLLVAFSVQIKNLILWGNPVYPVQFAIGGTVIIPGPMKELSDAPLYSMQFPQPYRWLLSILEYRAFDWRPLPYIIDQGDVPPEAMSKRVGGFMGIAVMMTVWMFVTAVRALRDKKAWTFAAVWIAMTLIIPVFPASHQLRYYMYWMIFGVISTIIMLNTNNNVLEKEKIFYRGFMLSVLVWVTLVTSGEWIVPKFRNMAVVAGGLAPVLEKNVKAGDVLCVTNGAPFSFLYAPFFHRELAAQRPYAIREMEALSNGGCRDLKQIPRL